jgi:hypothetical protein
VKLVGTICLVIKDDAGKTWSYDDVVYDPELSYSLLSIPFLGKYFARNDEANEFNEQTWIQSASKTSFSNGTMANINGTLNMEGLFFARIINSLSAMDGHDRP